MKNPKFLLTVFLLAIAAATPVQLAYSSTLTMMVFTDKPSYLVAEDIMVYGNLTYDGSPVPNWPVALEVQDPTGTPVVTRALQTDINGVYSLTFELPVDAELGTYSVYVSSGYKGETATDNTTFELMPRDIAVTNVTLSKTVVAQGYFMNITVTVENQGYPTETFNVTLDANTTSTTTQTVTLTSGNSTTIAFTWNTTGFAYGNYTVSAYAWPVPGETDTADNTLDSGSVIVTIPGDLNGDGTVDIFDAIMLAGAYGSGPTSANWNPNADINSDDIVDIFDAILLAGNFGRTMT